MAFVALALSLASCGPRDDSSQCDYDVVFHDDFDRPELNGSSHGDYTWKVLDGVPRIDEGWLLSRGRITTDLGMSIDTAKVRLKFTFRVEGNFHVLYGHDGEPNVRFGAGLRYSLLPGGRGELAIQQDVTRAAVPRRLRRIENGAYLAEFEVDQRHATAQFAVLDYDAGTRTELATRPSGELGQRPTGTHVYVDNVILDEVSLEAYSCR